MIVRVFTHLKLQLKLVVDNIKKITVRCYYRLFNRLRRLGRETDGQNETVVVVVEY